MPLYQGKEYAADLAHTDSTANAPAARRERILQIRVFVRRGAGVAPGCLRGWLYTGWVEDFAFARRRRMRLLLELPMPQRAPYPWEKNMMAASKRDRGAGWRCARFQRTTRSQAGASRRRSTCSRPARPFLVRARTRFGSARRLRRVCGRVHLCR